MTLTTFPTPPRRTRSAGLRARPAFSILEMLVTVILVTILMSIAGVRVAQMRSQQRVIRAASIVQTDLELAFALAQRNRTPTQINWNTTTYILKILDRAGTKEFKRSNLKDNSIGLSSGDCTTSSSSVTVFPNGFASDTFSITISKTFNGVTTTRRVRMSRAGLVKVL